MSRPVDQCATSRRTGACFVTLALLLGTALLAPARAENLPDECLDEIWTLGQQSAMKMGTPEGALLLQIAGFEGAQAATADDGGSVVWVYAPPALHAYDYTGQALFSVPVSLPVEDLLGVQGHLAANRMDGSLWLGVDRVLLHFGPGGQALNQLVLEEPVAGLAVAPDGSVVWVAATTAVTALDAVTGYEVQSLGLGPAQQVRDLDVERASGRVWVATTTGVRAYDPQGALLLDHPLADALQVAGDGDGGYWVGTTYGLAHLSSAGDLLGAAAPFLPGDDPVDLVADYRDGSIWAASGSLLTHQSANGTPEPPATPLDDPGWFLRDLIASILDDTPPEIEIVDPDEDELVLVNQPLIHVEYSDVCAGVNENTFWVKANGAGLLLNCVERNELRARCTPRFPLPEGRIDLWATVSDHQGNTALPAEVSFLVDAVPPTLDLEKTDFSAVVGGVTTLTGESGATEANASMLVTNLRTGDDTTVAVNAQGGFSGTLPAANGDRATIVITDIANRVSQTYSLLIPTAPREADLPADPAEEAPPNDPTVPTDFFLSVKFLWDGDNPIQVGVAPGAIDRRRVAVFRGRVLDQDGAPLPGVAVTVADHPELGLTFSRTDGRFDLAVNGGGTVVLDLRKDGYFRVQRQFDVPWRDFLPVEGVRLTQRDENVTAVAAGSAQVQVARGSVTTDGAGSRQASIFVPAGTTAQMILPDGTSQALSTLNIRATEYTVGPDGLEAMPGPLPNYTMYTYAVELSVDEAEAAGASQVIFSQPVYHYMENFLGFPVGEVVPAGYYDYEESMWVGSDDGQVLAVLAIDGSGRAQLDRDGSGQAADAAALAALGITDAERERLAELYSPGQELWRMPVPHFSPWDFNTPPVPEDVEEPILDTNKEEDTPNPCLQSGSIIECENQILHERIDVAGTAFDLHYSSRRVYGRQIRRALLDIEVTGGEVGENVTGLRLEIRIAGRLIVEDFLPIEGQFYSFIWDGLDVYGRKLYGSVPVDVRLGAFYSQTPARSASSSSGGKSWGSVGSSNMSSFALADGSRGLAVWAFDRKVLSAFDPVTENLAGWSLTGHHFYDHVPWQLQLGGGARVGGSAAPEVNHWVAGTGTSTTGSGDDGVHALEASIGNTLDIVATPEGGYYYIEDDPAGTADDPRIRYVDPDGIVTTVADGADGDFVYPKEIALGPDGSLYILDYVFTAGPPSYTVLRLLPTGELVPIYSAGELRGLAVSAGGLVYVANGATEQIWAIWPSALTAVPVAGKANTGAPYCGFEQDFPDGALEQQIGAPYELAMGPGGTLFIATSCYGPRTVFALRNGRLSRYGGRGGSAPAGYGAHRLDASFGGLEDLVFDRQGRAYMVSGADIISYVDREGTFLPFAGSNAGPYAGDGGPAQDTEYKDISGIAVTARGTLLVATNNRIHEIASPLLGYSPDGMTVPSEDGSVAYVFDGEGRHLETRDGITGVQLLEFAYDGEGRLIEIADPWGNVTRVERDGSGAPQAIVAPFGQRTGLTLNGDGYIQTITDPASASHTFTYDDEGLMLSMTDPRNGLYEFDYNPNGRLILDEDPAGGFKSLVRVEGADGSFTVLLGTAEERSYSYFVESSDLGDDRRVSTDPSGYETERLFKRDGTRQVTTPDGTVRTSVLDADPRFGIGAKRLTEASVVIPSGPTWEATFDRDYELSDPGDPFSLLSIDETATINDRVYTAAYDAADLEWTRTSPEGRVATSEIDAEGRPVASTVGTLEEVSLAYDTRGRLDVVSQGTGASQREIDYEYDAKGRLWKVTDALARTVEYGYDAADRVVSQKLPDNRVIGFGYDPAGNLTSVTPPSRPAHGFTYTAVDRMEDYTPPLVGATAEVTTYSYNLDRQVTQVTRPGPETIALGYTPWGRLDTVTAPNGVYTVTYDQDTGRVSELGEPGGGTLGYEWKGFLQTKETWSGAVAGEVTYTYDSDLRPATQAVAGSGAVTYTYDDDGLLTGAGALAVTRHAANGYVTSTTLDQVTTTRTYNGFGELASETVSGPGGDLLVRTYTRDNAGRIERVVESRSGGTQTWDYVYDLGGRLERVELDGNVYAEYGYDDNGNRASYDGPFGVHAGTYDAQDRLLTYGTAGSPATYTYSAAGELATKSQGTAVVTYDYDAFGNLRQVDLPSGLTIEYLIDARHRRIGRKVNGVLSQGFLYGDQLNPVAELDGAGNVVSRFVYGTKGNVPEYMVKAGVTYRIATDQLGSVRLVVNAATGAVAQEMKYDAFGRIVTDTSPGFQPFGFAGGLYDHQTGLVRFGARDYDGEVGRWTSKDPILFAGGDTNLYGYVLGDPVNFTDPTGWVSWGQVFSHYTKANGAPLDVPFSEIDPGFTPHDFAGFDNLVASAPDGKTPVSIPKLWDTDGPTGQSTCLLTGTLHKSAAGWLFTGDISGQNEMWNFDPKPPGGRTPLKEALTKLGSKVNGVPFMINYTGSRPVVEVGGVPKRP